METPKKEVVASNTLENFDLEVYKILMMSCKESEYRFECKIKLNMSSPKMVFNI